MHFNRVLLFQSYQVVLKYLEIDIFQYIDFFFIIIILVIYCNRISRNQLDLDVECMVLFQNSVKKWCNLKHHWEEFYVCWERTMCGV